MSKAVYTRAVAHKKAITDLNDRSRDLERIFKKSGDDIMQVYQSGWRDAHYRDLKIQFDKATEYLRPLIAFMKKASAHQKRLEIIIKKYNEETAPRSHMNR